MNNHIFTPSELLIQFENFTPNADVWIFYAEHPHYWKNLELLEKYTQDWCHHGESIQSHYCVYQEQFLFVVAQKNNSSDPTIGGCSRDSLFQTIKKINPNLRADLIQVKSNESIAHETRDSFRKKVQEQAYSLNTTVYDLSINKLSQLREIGFEKPAGNSWHSKAFKFFV